MRLLLNKRAMIPAVYLLIAAGWLLLRAVWFLGDGARAPQAVSLASAQPQNLAAAQEGMFVSETGDAQLVFAGPFGNVRLVRLGAAFSVSPGEMELFYTRGGQEDFSARRRVVGVPQADGNYLYALPAGEVDALRVDLGMIAGNRITLRELTLNPAMPPAFYFAPTLRDVLGAALWGALALCAFYTIIEEGWPPKRRAKRRGKKRQGENG